MKGRDEERKESGKGGREGVKEGKEREKRDTLAHTVCVSWYTPAA